ncbi:cytochrome o ubiquinol oxidase subunit IV [Phenylobacterium sp.]|uniref:cytochrome o ubiquinol oxidase subunit IV n=1 Tax=Phenylobacterium sp. TaxID=1871053 RepID=UPI0011F60D4F|nr:cytochrome o ubiquinol oxidase subunit IV [Phenylobacterium sp.]THD59280.1 MAG: cytochrome o ubiquinol oxidase subunit IV [Phenylobacterium sp.]
MTVESHTGRGDGGDAAPGEERGRVLPSLGVYLIGLVFALGLTATAFWVAQTHLLWAPGIPIGLCVLAIAQMGVHLVFFLHITTGPDNTNNVLALAFGVLIVFLVVAGSLWIMANLNHNMMPMDQLTNLHLQH